ncbi:MAG: DegV family protein [Acidimicrobiales bacterium]
MAGVRVVTDSACDLPPDLVAAHGITVVPLTIRFGSEELVDGQDLTPAAFWARVASSAVLPETAAPSAGAFEAAYRAAAADGAAGVVCITLSSSLSATCQAAQLAAQSVADDLPVVVVDSLAVSMGQGMMVANAARLAAEGRSLDEVVAAVNEMVPRTRIFAALDTLENLRKGGRIGAAQALLGSILSIKPIIEVTGGKVEPESRQRTRARSLRYLADKVREHQPVANLAVVHGSAPDVDQLLDLLDGVVSRADIVVSEVGAVIGTHAGPRVVGVTFTTAGAAG